MAIKCFYTLAMLYHNTISITSFTTSKGDFTVTCSTDRRSSRSRVIRAFVGANDVEHRMLAGKIEMRADACKFNWSAEKGFMHSTTIRSVIIAYPIFIDVADGLECFATVSKFGCHDFTGADFFSI